MRLGGIAALRWREWAPAALVSALVAVGGARLITLSTQQRIAENREATAGVAERTALRIEAELAALAERARLEAARAVDVLAPPRVAQSFESIEPDEQSFWMTGDGSLVSTADATRDAGEREALAREWSAGGHESLSAETEWLAPLRHGSQWLVATRAPVLMPSDTGVEHTAWAVVYRPLEEMLLNAGIDELPEDGYELAIGERAPGNDALRLLTGSPFLASLDHVSGLVRLPDASRATSSSDAYLVLALRPQSGWYSPALLAANVGLLLVVTWLLGLAAHDLTASQHRWRAALAVARQRLAATSRRLTEEVEESRLLKLSFDHARFHDTFTGLPNRRYFMNRLDQALRDVRGGRSRQIAVILADIDRFKLVNDTLGQTAGDELMVQVARRFENKMGTEADPGYVLARWSGDQFALLLFDVHSSATAMTFAKLIREALERPFVLRRHTLTVAAHIGVTCIDTQLQRTEDVVREADIALSVAKRREATDPVVYEAALGADVVSTVSLEADLHVALEREQFRLVFQPIVDLETGTVVGAEALLRWSHPVEGLLAPDRFLPIAEQTRMIVPISRWVIRRACELGGEWRRHVPPDTSFYVSVNLAAMVLDDPQLVPYVAGVLKETGLPAGSLRFELTEGDLTSHVGAAREVLGALHELGIGLVLDDFGTGHSSLSYLELFPIDCIKIDRPFINPADGSDSAVMRSVVHMASSLGLEAVAEKVETEAAVEALKRMGCKYGQGYLLGRPLEADFLLERATGRPVPASADSPTRVQVALSQPVAADAPTSVLRAQPAPATADTPTSVLPAASESVADDEPTVAQAERPTAAAADEPTVSVSVAAEPTVAQAERPTAAAADEPTVSVSVADDEPTVAQAERPTAAAADEPTVSVSVADDEPTVAQAERPTAATADEPTVSVSVADDEPTVAQAERPTAAAADEPTVEQPATTSAALDAAPPPALAASAADGASDGDERTIVDEALAPSLDGRPSLPQSGSRWRRRARMWWASVVQGDVGLDEAEPSNQAAADEPAAEQPGASIPVASDAAPPTAAAPSADSVSDSDSDERTIIDEALTPSPDGTPSLPLSGRRWRRRGRMSTEPLAQSDPTLVEIERPGTAAADQPAVKQPGAPSPVASDATPPTAAAPSADGAGDSVELTIIDEALAPSSDGSPSLPLSGRRWRRRGRLSTEPLTQSDLTLVEIERPGTAAADHPAVEQTDVPPLSVAAAGADRGSDGDEPTIIDEALAPSPDDSLPQSGRRWRRRGRMSSEA